jgi:pimeloyl-ACP methyl ester carboxylesterase
VDVTGIDARRLARRAGRVPTPAGFDRLELECASIRLRTEGRGGPPIAFVPDGPNVLEHYDELAGRLGDRHAILRFEMPGFGFSYPKPGYDFSPEAQSAVCAEVLEHAGAGPYVLAFSCSNAYIALRVASQRPDLVGALVAIQAPCWQDEQRWVRRIDPGGLIGLPVAGQILNALLARRLARTWYRAALPGEEQFDRFFEPAAQALRRGACFCLASLVQANRGRSLRFDPVAQPALAVWGARDRTHRHSDGRSILDHVPGARWIEFEEAGHFPELEQSGRFVEVLERFLADTNVQ